MNAQNMILGRLAVRTALTENYQDSDIRGNTVVKDVSTTVRKLDFHPPSWLIWLGVVTSFEARLTTSSMTGWKISLNAVRTQPDDSPMFKACRQGDIKTLRMLLSRGECSVWDIDSTHSTPLRWAAENHHAKVCQFLISHGADMYAHDMDRRRLSPLSRACWPMEADTEYQESTISESRQIQTFRHFVDAGFDLEYAQQHDFILGLAATSNRKALARWRGPATHFEFPSCWILKQMLPSIVADPLVYDAYFWAQKLKEELWNRPGRNAATDVLPYCGIKAIRRCLLDWCHSLFVCLSSCMFRSS